MKSDRTDLDMVSFPSAELWEDYNTFVFNWSPFCDGDCMNPFGVGAGEWSKDELVPYRYTDEKGNKAVATAEMQKETMKHSIAEVFVSSYVYLMQTHNFTSNSIQISGHSMGGQLTAAVASYMFYAYENGGLPARYMPSAFYLLDPFLDSYDVIPLNGNRMFVDWSGEAFGERGTAGLAYDAMKKGEELGVPICYVLSGTVHTMVSTTLFKTIRNNVIFIDLDPYHLDIGGKHGYAPDWFYLSNDAIIMEETSGKTNYGLTAKTHFSYLLGMTGANLHLTNNEDLDLTNDTIEALNETPAIINGYVFYDDNGNGIFDENYGSRAQNKEVEIYANGTKIATVTTGKGGYYRFEIPTSYLNATLEVRVNGKITKLGTASTDNLINSNGFSAPFTISAPNQAVLINVGLIK